MLTYFLQVNLCWLIFYGLYYVLLSKETFFKLNRIYLIISLLCGLALPFFTERLSQMQEVSTMPIMEIAQPIAQSISIFQENIEMQMPSTETSWNLWLILRGLYMVGIFYFLTQSVVGLWRIFKLYKNGVKEKNKGFTLVNTEGVKAPFSFFKLIFINSEIAQTVDFQHIIMHEKAHVQQKHSFDIVGIETLRGLFWLSPLVHLYARSLRHVHEYLADAAVLQNTEKKQYGRLLINQTAAGSGLILANHFNFSQLKKRVIMMTRNRSQRVALMKYTLAAPLVIVLIILLATPKNGLMAKTDILSEGINNTITKNKIPEPFPTLNGLRGSSIEIKKFKELDEMIPYEKNEFGYFKAIPKDIGEIESFTVRIKDEGDAIFCQGNQFNEAAKRLISNAKQGNTFHFENIIYKMNSGAMLKWNLGEMYFNIKKEPVTEWSTRAVWFVKPLPPIYVLKEVPADAELLTCTINHYINGELKPSEQIQFTGFTWSEEASRLFQKAQIGDVYEFANIKVRRRGHTKIDDFASIRYKLN